jgi:hypothetical protein
MENYKELKAEWYETLQQLWDAYGKPVNQAQLKLYAKKLSDVPLGILEHTVDEVIARHTYNSVPTLGEIQEVLNNLHTGYKYETYVNTTPSRDAYDRGKMRTVAQAKAEWGKLAVNL